MRCAWIGMLCCVGALAGCSDQLSKEEIELLGAVVFALDNIEENTQEKHKLEPWKRRVTGKTIEFSTIGRHSYGFSDNELNVKLRDSSFVRFTEKISSPEKCVFHKESLAEFSKGDSKTDFSVYDMGKGTTIINLMNAYRFELVSEGPTADVNLEGPSVACHVGSWCSNSWNKQIFPEDYYSYNQKPPSVLRREKAVTLIKRACPGKPY